MMTKHTCPDCGCEFECDCELYEEEFPEIEFPKFYVTWGCKGQWEKRTDDFSMSAMPKIQTLESARQFVRNLIETTKNVIYPELIKYPMNYYRIYSVEDRKVVEEGEI